MVLGAFRKLKVIKKIGFACKWIDHAGQLNGIDAKDDAKQYNTGSTTVAWLNRQSRDIAEEKLWDLTKGNIEAVRKLVERVGTLDENLRMVRLGSDILPMYTQRDWKFFYRLPDVRNYIERGFREVGDLARKNGVRLSFHPGQFTVLASDNPGIVDNSIEEFEYHADMAKYMGFGQQFQDFKINVHISGKQGPEGIRRAYQRLSTEARNCITIENEENAWGLDDCLTISDLVPIVLDVHHHWIKTGDYISPLDSRVDRVVQSWRGVRPTMHYSVSREDYLVDHNTVVAPDYKVLLEDGYKKQKLRAHSDFYWNTATNEWALSFLNTHDIMCESKGKNIASFALANQAKALGLL
jgi:UV DNA damage endonuclease